MFLLTILFLSSCCTEVRKAEREKYYEIDVFGDSKKELFLVEDKLFVGDSCLGTFSEENYQKNLSVLSQYKRRCLYVSHI